MPDRDLAAQAAPDREVDQYHLVSDQSDNAEVLPMNQRVANQMHLKSLSRTELLVVNLAGRQGAESRVFTRIERCSNVQYLASCA